MQNPARVIPHLDSCIVLSTADCSSVLELGCGVGDKLALCQADYRHGVDAHRPYLERARERWGPRLHVLDHRDMLAFAKEAVVAKQGSGEILWDAVLLIDVLEHLFRPEGRRVLFWCRELARRRIVVYCPENYEPQHHDSYDLGGEAWQTHRSAWWADDFERRGFDTVRWENQNGPDRHAIFAIWNQP